MPTLTCLVVFSSVLGIVKASFDLLLQNGQKRLEAALFLGPEGARASRRERENGRVEWTRPSVVVVEVAQGVDSFNTLLAKSHLELRTSSALPMLPVCVCVCCSSSFID